MYVPVLLGRADKSSCANIHMSNIGQYVMGCGVEILCKQDIQTSTPVCIRDVYYKHNGLV